MTIKRTLITLALTIGLNQQLAATEIGIYAPGSLITGYALAHADSKDTRSLCAIAALITATLITQQIDSNYELKKYSRSENNQMAIIVLTSAGFTLGMIKQGMTKLINKISNKNTPQPAA